MIEIIDSPRVRSYELTYLVPVSLTTSEVASVHDAVAGFIKKTKGTVITQEDWGKKELAYAIRHAGKDQREAHYMHLVLELPTEAVQIIERELGLQPNIMRHLLVLAEAVTPAAPAQENEAAI